MYQTIAHNQRSYEYVNSTVYTSGTKTIREVGCLP